MGVHYYTMRIPDEATIADDKLNKYLHTQAAKGARIVTLRLYDRVALKIAVPARGLAYRRCGHGC